MAGEGTNNINVNISVVYKGEGLAKAVSDIKNFVQQVNNLSTTTKNAVKEANNFNSSAKGMGDSAKKTGGIISETAKQTRILFNDTKATKIAFNESATAISNLSKQGNAMVNTARSTSVAINNMATGIQFSNRQTSMLGMSFTGTTSTFQKFTGAVSSGIGRINGYMSGLIKTSISVGDVFGYYIGTMALGAITELVTKVSIARNEMVTTFEYMGYAKEDVASFTDELMKWAVALPKMSIAAANTMANILVMSGASMGDVSKWKGALGDIQAIAVGLRQISPEEAANKTAMAISQAMTGRYIRLAYVMGVTATQFKEKAKEMGFSNEDLKNNFNNTMAVLQELVGERGLTGVSEKLTSFTDVWNYFSELLSEKASMLGDTLVVTLIPVIKAVADGLAALPLPIFGAGLAFVTLTAGLLVFLPLAASVVNSFTIMGVALAPILNPLRNLSYAFRGLSQEVKLTEAGLIKFYSAQKGVTVGGPVSAIPWQEKGTRFDPKAGKEVGYGQIKGQEKGFAALTTRIKGATKSLTAYNAANRISVPTMAGTKAGMAGVGASARGAGAGFKAFGMSILGATKAMLVFMFTTPIGLLLTIAGAIILLITVTGQWGNVMKALGSAWTKIKNALKPLTDALTKWVVGVGTAIQQWKGWDYIIEGLKLAGNYLMQLGGAIASAFSGAGASGLKGFSAEIGKLFDLIKYIIGGVTTFYQIITTGKGAFKDTNQQIFGTIIGLMTLISPIGIVMALFLNLKEIIMRVKEEFRKWAESPMGVATFTQLGIVIDALKIALGSIGSAFGQVWTEIQPAIKSLGEALGLISDKTAPVADGLNQIGDAGGEAAPQFSLVNVVVQGLIWLIQGAIPVIQAITWLIVNVTIPTIKLLIPIINTVLGVITFLINVGKALYDAYQKVALLFGPIGTIILGMVAPIQSVTKAIMDLWHWITGNSPGIIPAFQLLLAIVRVVWPLFKSIIVTVIVAVLSKISSFVSSTVSWFKSLPGKVKSALSGLKQAIIDQITNAYNGAKDWVKKFYDIGKSIKDYVVNGIKGALGISSPSKVTYGLGEMISQGLLNGMENWVKKNSGIFSKYIASDARAASKILSDLFGNFKWINYMGDVDSVGKTLGTMTGNCYDAAQAFIALAQQIGLSAQMYRTFVNGVPHRIVNLPSIGAWIDPSGIMGRGLQKGTAPGSPAGYNFNVYIKDPVVKEEEDFDTVARVTGSRIVDMLRFGV